MTVYPVGSQGLADALVDALMCEDVYAERLTRMMRGKAYHLVGVFDKVTDVAPTLAVSVSDHGYAWGEDFGHVRPLSMSLAYRVVPAILDAMTRMTTETEGE